MNSVSNGNSIENGTASCKSNVDGSDTKESFRSSSGVGGDARARRLGKLNAKHTAVFVCDIQERFASSIAHFDTIVGNTERILKVVNMLGLPTIATEQYPKVFILHPCMLDKPYEIKII
jgi:hypothetical protein